MRYDHRLGGRRETLTIGRHEPAAREAPRSHLAYGMNVTLEEARLLLARARVDVSSGRSPAKAKVEQRNEVTDALTFGRWTARYFEFKSDAKSGGERLADSTLSLRRSIYTRILEGPFAKLNLDEIRPVALGELLDRVKAERGPGPAVHARELVLQVYRFAVGKGVDVDNPAEALARKASVGTRCFRTTKGRTWRQKRPDDRATRLPRWRSGRRWWRPRPRACVCLRFRSRSTRWLNA